MSKLPSLDQHDLEDFQSEQNTQVECCIVAAFQSLDSTQTPAPSTPPRSAPPLPAAAATLAWTPRQQQAMGNLLRIRAVALQYIQRQELERTTQFLWAASQGNEPKVRQFLQQGCPVNSADYDGRSALELACAKGHAGVARMLLAAGADANQQDALGSCPLLEACK